MDYEKSMKRCIELAKRGVGSVSPNPMAGCVVYDKNDNLIAEGWHQKYGENHAERNALLSLKCGDAAGGTLFVNLEPCSHYGKTPPCADLIIEHGLKTVVIGMRDVNPIVQGNGIKKLKDAGIEVVEDVLLEECRKLNEVFITNITEHRIFAAIKTASTFDGKIASKTGSSKWITGKEAREEVKVIRNKYDALMTSSTTVIADNPTMEHKIKIILDRSLKTDFASKIYQSGRVVVFFDENLERPEAKNIEFIQTPVIDGKLSLEFVFNKLYEMKIMSVLIEAGGHLNGSALKYIDKIYHFMAPKILGDNEGLSCFNNKSVSDINECNNFEIDEIKRFGNDILLTYYPIAKNN